MREHNEAVNRLDVIAAARRRSTVDHEPGTVEMVTQHDGSVLALHKLAEHYDPTDRIAAISYLQAAPGDRARSSPACSMSTPRPATCTRRWTRWTSPLNTLSDAELTPSLAALEALNASFR